MRELQAQVVNATLKDELVESRELRNKLIVNETVFEDSRVKALTSFLLPKDFGATTEHVANYFEVGEECINSLVKDNRTELLSNGMVVNEGEQLKFLKDTCRINSRARAITTFSRRAILNVAMLLRDSPVAKTIRSVLLDATENKTVVKEIVNQQVDMSQLSSSLQAFGKLFQSMVQMELNQKKIQSQLEQVNDKALEAKATAEKANDKINTVKEAMLLDHDSWRNECNNIINKIAKEQRGGSAEAYKDVRNEVYSLVEQRAGANLKQRVVNKQDRMRREGLSKSNVNKISKIDVIAEDKRLKEIYIALVKEIAIKYGVE